ncbi:Ribonuclease T2-like protein [Corchorus olitorius]|uniref:Ribonuclease T2-like protein n=1 Tax=Corchorus olitorius TaxID=93759 RepID=A0A1R3HCJ8_9ROSI|nr:Ribonuclease T2-like protein [Corchorus olitorius]
MKKSSSMGNLPSHAESNNASSPVEDDHGYLSDGQIHSRKHKAAHERRGKPWTEEEHRIFLEGLRKLGKGIGEGFQRIMKKKMASLSAQTLLLCVAFMAVTSLTLSVEGEQREFDYFVLSLQWPGTACQNTKKCCSSNGCCRGENSPAEFTIQKHGTCCTSVVGDEYNYFLTTLNLFFKYNVTNILNEAGYVPSNSEKYPLGGVVSAIENSFQATPEVVCSKDAVEEIRLCFYKDFKPLNCLASKTSCPEYVSFPTHASYGLKEFGTDIASISYDEAL